MPRAKRLISAASVERFDATPAERSSGNEMRSGGICVEWPGPQARETLDRRPHRGDETPFALCSGEELVLKPWPMDAHRVTGTCHHSLPTPARAFPWARRPSSILWLVRQRRRRARREAAVAADAVTELSFFVSTPRRGEVKARAGDLLDGYLPLEDLRCNARWHASRADTATAGDDEVSAQNSTYASAPPLRHAQLLPPSLACSFGHEAREGARLLNFLPEWR